MAKFYPARGTSAIDGYVEGNTTQYGLTSTYCGLQLHMGNYLYKKRGGSKRAFLFDPVDDYRYYALIKLLGLDDMPACGALLGNFVDQVEHYMIKFKVTEEHPTHLLLALRYSPELILKLEKIEDAIFSIAPKNKWVQAAFWLNRNAPISCGRVEDYDDYYDIEPDEVDLCVDYAEDGLSGEDLTRIRLQVAGF
ncbi:hypothetical protein IJ102_02890 [Candidatus Saccharibacteria bacterium]|nr:hypothetical protein [Candidatus Saccharibacteria bacterium]